MPASIDFTKPLQGRRLRFGQRRMDRENVPTQGRQCPVFGTCLDARKSRVELFCYGTERQNNFTKQFVQHLREAGVDGSEAAEDSFVTGEMFERGTGRGEIAKGEEEEQNRERGEDNLQSAV